MLLKELIDDPIVSFVGDIMFDRDIKKNITADFFDDVAPMLGFGSFSVCNLETPITNHPQQFDKTSFSTLNIPHKFPFEVANISNNHILDSGIKGLEDTVKFLTSNGIKIAGLPDAPVILSKSGKRFGILGYASDEFETAFPDEFREFNIVFNKEKFKKDITILKEELKCDFVIVGMHWGIEYAKADMKQTEIGHYLIDNGVDFVWGHHPHVQQKIEEYKNKIIAYSLGNFVFQHIENDTPETRKGKILQVSFGKEMKFVEIETVCEGPVKTFCFPSGNGCNGDSEVVGIREKIAEKDTQRQSSFPWKPFSYSGTN